MVSKHRDPTRGRGYRPSETEHFLASMPNSQWILIRHGQVWRPPTDVYETEDSVVVKVEVAGMAEEDFSIVFSEQTLVIAGTRRDYATKRGYHQMEIPYGEFRTEVYISETVDTDNVEALYKDGFLTVTVPMRKARRVTIHPNAAS
jgi:HSP20 family protein